MATQYESWGEQLQDMFPCLDFSPKSAVKVPVTRVSQLVQGDLVCVLFHERFHNSLPWHFGIAMGNLQVMDLVQGRKPEVAVVEVEDFVGDNRHIYVIPQNSDDQESQRQSAYNRAHALKALIEHSPSPVYQLSTFNCRHFATICCAGRCVTNDPLKHCLNDFPDPLDCEQSHGLCGKAQVVNILDIFDAGMKERIHRSTRL